MPDNDALTDLVLGERCRLRRSQDLVATGRYSLGRGHAAVATATAWFRGMYTTAALVGGALSGQVPSLGQGARYSRILLMVAYMASIWALVPIPLTMDPRNPNDRLSSPNAHSCRIEDVRGDRIRHLTLRRGCLVDPGWVVATGGPQSEPGGARTHSPGTCLGR